MPQSTADNPLLQEIKTAIEAVLPAQSSISAPAMTTESLRQNILDILVEFSHKIPHPAGTAAVQSKTSPTLIRWQILAFVSGIDLTIAKWFESHLDALSILNEVSFGNEKAASGLWAVWAAEGSFDPICYRQGNISGTKAWCSGANFVDFALMTYRDDNGDAQLISVDMSQSGIEIDNQAWQAVGMQATDTATVRFQEVAAKPIGAANSYLDRAGFWHGAAGVAACWYGAATALASYLARSYEQKPHDFKAMYLGQISTALAVTQQYFYHTAELMDTQPKLSHELAIRQLRANTEQTSRQVVDLVGQALGAAPFCINAHFARLSADLLVFIRQSHGAFDLQKIGELTCAEGQKISSATENRGNLWQL